MVISCVTEVQIPDIAGSVLAIGVQYETVVGSMISLFSVQGARVLRSIEIAEKVTSMCHISYDVMYVSGLKYIDGLIYGTEMGQVFVLDLCFKKCTEGNLN